MRIVIHNENDKLPLESTIQDFSWETSLPEAIELCIHSLVAQGFKEKAIKETMIAMCEE